ncbi:MAG TPA: translation initiation factor IF-2 N-terminal domain-containing protein, partial [Pyrinomonadaceae bacterium]|nr:translation initiation factor IF-2 N-terminal domain-containing protein [Pyrinomonadaceae bacterium]
MTVSSKVRIYDLAKELKLDTKRLIEEVRREGVDVSVPSNSVSKEMAEKIRNKYFPKKEAAVKRTVKVVKRATLPTPEAPVIE